MPPSSERGDIAGRLVTRLKQRNKTFKKGSNHAKLLDLYLQKFPEAATNDEASRALGGISAHTPISRLNADLKQCFKMDRSLWREQQMLVLSDTGPNQTHSLELRPLGEGLSPSMRMWFHQSLNVSMPQKKEDLRHKEEPQPYVVISEPLFFFAPSLGAYFRFLDLNYDALFPPNDVRLVTSAKSHLSRMNPQRNEDDSVRAALEDVDLVPVRLYLPAGDSYAKTAIRRWFRDNLKHRVGYKPGSAVSVADSVNSNLIVLASRSSLPLLAEFQQRHRLRLRLAENGITCDDDVIDDEVTIGEGTTLSHVIVTNWTLETGRVHTYVASNHTRAVQAVTELLVSDDEMLNEISTALMSEGGGKIPGRFQIAFRVSLHLHETNATVEGMLRRLDGRPLVY